MAYFHIPTKERNINPSFDRCPVDGLTFITEKLTKPLAIRSK